MMISLKFKDSTGFEIITNNFFLNYESLNLESWIYFHVLKVNILISLHALELIFWMCLAHGCLKKCVICIMIFFIFFFLFLHYADSGVKWNKVAICQSLENVLVLNDIQHIILFSPLFYHFANRVFPENGSLVYLCFDEYSGIDSKCSLKSVNWRNRFH